MASRKKKVIAIIVAIEVFICILCVISGIAIGRVTATAPSPDVEESETYISTGCDEETLPDRTETPPTISDKELELLALVTMAEAEGESEYGKRLVIDTILNRVDSVHFPDTITDVIYQPGQFTSMWNGRADRCEVTDEVRQLVLEEVEFRANHDVIFFRTDYYSPYGTPMFNEGNHYFSKY